jgi:hypothetical protein
MPRLALASWPVMFHEMVVGEDSEACSKVTVPVIFVSPRMKATMQDHHQYGSGKSNPSKRSCQRDSNETLLRGSGLGGTHPGALHIHSVINVLKPPPLAGNLGWRGKE